MDSTFMLRAIELAKKAYTLGEIPVGAVIVKDGRIIGEGYNMRENKNLLISHAEIEAISSANKTLGDWRLEGATIYVTLEPCLMCAGAIADSRIKEIVFGAYDLERGFVSSKADIGKLTSKDISVFAGIKENECKALLDSFFSKVRENNGKL